MYTAKPVRTSRKRGPEIIDVLRRRTLLLSLTLISFTHNYENCSVPAYLNPAFPPLPCPFAWSLARKCLPFVLLPIFYPSWPDAYYLSKFVPH